jgi:TP901 family phage tail tape measure protein
MAFAETQYLRAVISLEDGLTKGVNKALKSVGRLESGLGRAGKGVGQVAGGMVVAGAKIAAAGATGLAFAAKTAIEFDDAFAGVRKTVEASGPELEKLNSDLHALATRIPVGYTDLAAIAAEAGALGVPTEQVAKFTEVVARLSASTQGLSVDAAAEAFGKFRNVLHLSDSDLERAGSALIALGNAGASSEADIIEVAKRFGAAGRMADLSAAQVLGFSSAIASMGVEPEAAGSSLSRLFSNITQYLGTGDSKIKAFAKTSGLSVKAFKKLFAKDAAGAVELFLTNLGKLNKFKAAEVLKDAGITDVRQRNAVVALSQNVDELKKQVDLSTAAFENNTALMDVSNKRFDSLKNKITVLKNNFLEAAYNVAEGFLPALGRAADKLTTFLSLPENKKSLQELGKNLGDIIDRIDWGGLLKSAKGAMDVIKPMLDALLGIAKVLGALPNEVKGGLAALVVGNKLSGGLLGTGAANIIGGLTETITRNLGSKIPGIGGAFVQKVWVVNFPPGVGSGGVPGVATSGAGRLASAVKIIGSVAIAGASIAALVDTFNSVNASSTAQARGIKQNLDENINNKSQAELQTALDGVNQGIKDLQSNPLYTLVQGEALDQLRAMRAELETKLGPLKQSQETTRLATSERLDAIKSGLGQVSTGTIGMQDAERVLAGKQDIANARLAAIQAKRTSFVVNNNITVKSTVSIASHQQAAAISARINRTTALAGQ